MKIRIFDIDGTLADHEHRLHFIENGNKDWASFIKPELVLLDKPIIKGCEMAKRFYEDGQNILFLTGRNEKLREVTMQWLNKHVSSIHESYLVMRPIGDNRVASEFKAEIIKRHVGELSTNKFLGINGLAFDDDLYMTPVYEKYGLLHLHAPQCWGTLHPAKVELPPEVTWRK